jgi:hypothetical protein
MYSLQLNNSSYQWSFLTAEVRFPILGIAKLAAAKEEFNKMLAAGIIRRSSSQWSSPLH